jgi:hypothetical protein
MIDACKFCEHKIPVPDLGDDWWCPVCQKYSIVCLDNSIVESETIRAGNFYMVFFPAYKTASIASTDDDDKKIMKSFEMNELTHEQAVQWVNKLKTYVLFQ